MINWLKKTCETSLLGKNEEQIKPAELILAYQSKCYVIFTLLPDF